MIQKTMLCLLAATALFQGCSPEDSASGDAGVDGGAGDLAPTGTSLNGTSLNGTSLNGTSLNGTSLNGTSLNGTSLNGTSLNGTSLNGTSLNGTSLNGTSLNGTSLNGADLVGSIWAGSLSSGEAISLRLDSFTQLGGANADVSAYGVSYETQSGWEPLCGLDANAQPVLAIPMMGTWNYQQGVAGGGSFTASSTSFTFACRTTAIAKCVELGYKPWHNVAGTSTSLQDHLVACTRALRADYCGDGTPHTVTGTSINIYDAVDVQADTESWAVEAEWTASGARFVRSGGSGFRYQLGGGSAPSCVAGLASSDAGDTAHFSSGTLIINEY
jgi:hypothetical protein